MAAAPRGVRGLRAAEARAFEAHSVEHGVAAVRAKAAWIWLGAGRLDKVAETIGMCMPAPLAALPRDCDWLLILQCAALLSHPGADTEALDLIGGAVIVQSPLDMLDDKARRACRRNEVSTSGGRIDAKAVSPSLARTSATVMR